MPVALQGLRPKPSPHRRRYVPLVGHLRSLPDQTPSHLGEPRRTGRYGATSDPTQPNLNQPRATCVTHEICVMHEAMARKKRTIYAISPAQCRAARGLLGWSRERLAEASGVGARSVADFELATTLPRMVTVERLQAALTVGGVIFIPDNGGGRGVRFAAPETESTLT